MHSTRSGQSTNHNFTRRELDVLDALAAGLSNKEIGRRLSISPLTVRQHIAAAGAKLGEGRRMLIALAYMRQAKNQFLQMQDSKSRLAVAFFGNPANQLGNPSRLRDLTDEETRDVKGGLASGCGFFRPQGFIFFPDLSHLIGGNIYASFGKL
jgi:DNA-binding CsgD family transcriptional regulator